MVKNPLADPCDSVEHAKGHIEEIESLARLFLESRPYTIIAKPDPLYPTHQIMYAKLAKPIPVRIHGLALDAVKNLRGALDQLGFAVAVAAGKSGKNAHFPFGEKPKDLESRRKYRSKDIYKEIFDLMAAFKPYKGGNEALWRLNKLANVSKHENFVRAYLFTTEITYERLGIMLTTGAPEDATEDEIPIAWIRRGQTQPYDSLKIGTTIRFNDVGGVVFPQPAITLLREFARIVDDIIARVGAEARRLGVL